MNEKKLVSTRIDEMRDEAIGLLQNLIRIPSPNPPGDEKEIADFCATYMRDMGMDVEQIEPFKRRVSNVGRLKGKARTPVLLFYSHSDTVPPGNASKLRFPAFGAEIHDGCIWGAGATNMKVGMAAALMAAKVLKNCCIDLSGDILLAQGADEMTAGQKGAAQLVRLGMFKGVDWAIYTEAHPRQHYDEDRIEIGSRGKVALEITVQGRRAHTGQKERGLNAILKMLEVAKAIDSMEFKYWHPHPTIKFGDKEGPIISVNRIRGGFALNQVADTCTIYCDCRTLPGQTRKFLLNDVNEVVEKLKAEDPDLVVDVKVTKTARPWFIDPEAPIVKAMQHAISEVTGKSISVSGVASTSDARWLMLDAKIPICKFTFGDIVGRRMFVDEYQSIDRYIDTIKVYATLMINLLK